MVIDSRLNPDLIGCVVTLPDGGLGTITSLCVAGQFRRIQWEIVYWYAGNCNKLWVEPCEVVLRDVVIDNLTEEVTCE